MHKLPTTRSLVRALPLAILVSLVVLALTATPAVAVDETPISSNGNYCVGSQLTLDGRGDKELWRLGSDQELSFVRNYIPDDGVTTIDTRHLSPGQYVIREDDDDPPLVLNKGKIVREGAARQADWNLRRCDGDATFVDNRITVRPGQTASSTLTLSFPENRVDITAQELDNRTLRSFVGGSLTEDGIRRSIPNNGELDVDVSYERACRISGRLALTVTGATSGVSDRATLFVDIPDRHDYAFDNSLYQVSPDGTVDIPIELEGCAETLTVRLTGQNGVEAVAQVTDSNNDNRLTLQVDTAALPDRPDELVTVTGGDTIEELDVTGEAITNGRYQLDIETEERNRAGAELFVEPLETTTTEAGDGAGDGTGGDDSAGGSDGGSGSTPTTTSGDADATDGGSSETTATTGPGFTFLTALLALLVLVVARRH